MANRRSYARNLALDRLANPANLLPVASAFYRGPRIIATDRQAPRVYPRMIPLCSRFDSVLFTPTMSAIASYGNFSRSPIV
jgi:hypothetical protein